MNRHLQILQKTMEKEHFLVKSFEKEIHSQLFSVNGEMLISRVDYFQKLESDVRADKNDGKVISNIKFLHGETKSVPIGNGLEMKITADMANIDIRSMMFWIHSHDNLDFIYSMSAYEDSVQYNNIKDKQIDYGKYCVAITKGLEFMRRFSCNISFLYRNNISYSSKSIVEKQLGNFFERTRWKNSNRVPRRHLWSFTNEDFFRYIGFGLVKYSNEKSKDEFTKSKYFELDFEFRICYNDTYAKELPLRNIVSIGDISDISIRCTKSNLYTTLLLANKSRILQKDIL